MTTDFSNDFKIALAKLGQAHSDCEVICGKTTTFKLHKIILHLHSPILAREFSERWEGTTRSPEITDLGEEHDSEVLRAMFDYFYQFEYRVPASCASPQAFHVMVFEVANKYGVRSLEDYAHDRLNEMSDPADWSMIDFNKVAELLSRIETTTSAGRFKELAVLVLKRKISSLVGDARWLDFVARYPDWIVDVLADLAMEAGDLRTSRGVR